MTNQSSLRSVLSEAAVIKWRYFRRITLPIFLAFVLFVCIVPIILPAAVKAAEELLVTLFSDNTDTFETRTPDQTTVRNIIRNNIKGGYETFDFALIRPILAPGFELLYLADHDTLLVEDLREYLRPRKKWEVVKDTIRKLHYSIQAVIPDDSGKSILVTGFSMYQSRYFNPRFLETLLFEKADERWLLKRQLLVPLHPNRPELYDVQIFVVKPCDVSERNFEKLAITHGVDAFMDQCLKGSYDSLPYEAGALILFVFREPPPVGAEIKTELVYERTYGDFPFDFTYKVKKSDPYFVIANEVYSEDLDGWFIMRVYVDGIKVGERKIGA